MAPINFTTSRATKARLHVNVPEHGPGYTRLFRYSTYLGYWSANPWGVVTTEQTPEKWWGMKSWWDSAGHRQQLGELWWWHLCSGFNFLTFVLQLHWFCVFTTLTMSPATCLGFYNLDLKYWFVFLQHYLARLLQHWLILELTACVFSLGFIGTSPTNFPLRTRSKMMTTLLRPKVTIFSRFSVFVI